MITRDILWKGIIEDLFDDFLRYFFPNFSKRVNFRKKFEFLDKELDALLPEAEAGKRYVDKLVKVFTKTGKAHFVLLHVEVQGYKDVHFAKRMYTYFYRIMDRWQADVTALALYTDEDMNYLPTQYVYEFEGTKNVYSFNTFKLLHQTEEALEMPNNPFSIVMKVAHKALQKQFQTDVAQLVWKTDLVRELYRAGYPKPKIRNIFNFIRYYVSFEAKQNNQKLDTQIQTITKQRTPMGIEQAIKEAIIESIKAEALAEGLAKGKKEDVFGMFAEGLSVEAIVRITKLPLDTIQTWQKQSEATS